MWACVSGNTVPAGNDSTITAREMKGKIMKCRNHLRTSRHRMQDIHIGGRLRHDFHDWR